MSQPRCGDGLRDATEMCEPNDLAGATCMSLGFSGGILNCNKTTCAYDTLMCRMTTGTAGGGGNSGGAGTSGGTAGSGT
jgi:hypothetical protein